MAWWMHIFNTPTTIFKPFCNQQIRTFDKELLIIMFSLFSPCAQHLYGSRMQIWPEAKQTHLFFFLQDFMFWFFFWEIFCWILIIKRNYDFAGLLNSWTWQSKCLRFIFENTQTHSHPCDKYWISIPLQIDLENVLFAIFGTVVVI